MQLVGDIGGTNARFAWLDEAGDPYTPMTLPVRDYVTIGDAMRDFMARTNCTDLREFAVAVACPAMADTVKFTNNPWVFSKPNSIWIGLWWSMTSPVLPCLYPISVTKT